MRARDHEDTARNRRAPARGGLRSRRIATFPSAAIALALAAAAPSAASAQNAGAASTWPNYGPAQDWRFIKGPGVDGALRLSQEISEANGRAIGHIVLLVEGQGFFHGVYNLRDDGRSAIGVFWRDGEPLGGPIEGVVDIGYSPIGAPLGETEARVTFIAGQIFEGAQAE